MIEALNDIIVVEVYKPTTESVRESGIIMPTDKKEHQYNGTVVSLGTDEAVARSGLKIGDRVYYQKGQNFTVTIDDVEYDCVSVFDILAKESQNNLCSDEAEVSK